MKRIFTGDIVFKADSSRFGPAGFPTRSYSEYLKTKSMRPREYRDERQKKSAPTNLPSRRLTRTFSDYA